MLLLYEKRQHRHAIGRRWCCSNGSTCKTAGPLFPRFRWFFVVSARWPPSAGVHSIISVEPASRIAGEWSRRRPILLTTTRLCERERWCGKRRVSITSIRLVSISIALTIKSLLFTDAIVPRSLASWIESADAANRSTDVVGLSLAERILRMSSRNAFNHIVFSISLSMLSLARCNISFRKCDCLWFRRVESE